MDFHNFLNYNNSLFILEDEWELLFFRLDLFAEYFNFKSGYSESWFDVYHIGDLYNLSKISLFGVFICLYGNFSKSSFKAHSD